MVDMWRGGCSVCLVLQHTMCGFFKPEHIQPGFWDSVPLCGPSGSLLVMRRPRCSLLQPRTPSSLKLSTSTCMKDIKDMWRAVADLEDRRTDLCHSSMHKLIGRSICPTGKRNRTYHHSVYSESKSKLYRKVSKSYKCIRTLIVTDTRHYYAALVWSCTNFVHSMHTDGDTVSGEQRLPSMLQRTV